jgi:hypothetical protein
MAAAHLPGRHNANPVDPHHGKTGERRFWERADRRLRVAAAAPRAIALRSSAGQPPTALHVEEPAPARRWC